MATKSETSEFSIDYILNRAGDKFKTTDLNFDKKNYALSEDCYKHYSEDERMIQVPSFHWLSYTRYNMPRTRKFELILKFSRFLRTFPSINNELSY